MRNSNKPKEKFPLKRKISNQTSDRINQEIKAKQER